jgi:hypothetical protein
MPLDAATPDAASGTPPPADGEGGDDAPEADGDVHPEEDEREADDGAEERRARIPDPSTHPAVQGFLARMALGTFGSAMDREERKTLLRAYAMPAAIAGKAPPLNEELVGALAAKHARMDGRAEELGRAAFELQRQPLSPLLAAMAAIADGDLVVAAQAVAHATTLVLANVAATTMDRRAAALAPLGKGYAQLAHARQACGPGTPLFEVGALARAMTQQHALIQAVGAALGDSRPPRFDRARGGSAHARSPAGKHMFRGAGRGGPTPHYDARGGRPRTGFFRGGPGGSRGAARYPTPGPQ